jgi:hypothetical protein
LGGFIAPTPAIFCFYLKTGGGFYPVWLNWAKLNHFFPVKMLRNFQ